LALLLLYFSRWGFDYSSCPTGGDFDFSKVNPPPLPGRGVVGDNIIDRCIANYCATTKCEAMFYRVLMKWPWLVEIGMN